MNKRYKECDYENSIIELFENMVYRYIYGPDIDRNFYSPFYEEELENALFNINNRLPYSAIKDAMSQLKNSENGSLIQKNSICMDYLQNGITVNYFDKDKEKKDIIYYHKSVDVYRKQ